MFMMLVKVDRSSDRPYLNLRRDVRMGSERVR